MTLAAPDIDIDLTVLEQFDEPPLCESLNCEARGKGAHEAHYVGRLPCCGHSYLVCRERVARFRVDRIIHCDACDSFIHSKNIGLTEL